MSTLEGKGCIRTSHIHFECNRKIVRKGESGLKTGVALMGDGYSAAAAIGALAAIRRLDIRVAAVSATGTAALPALLFCQEVDTSAQLGALMKLLRFENRGGPVSRWRRKRRLTKVLERAGIAPLGPLPPACALSAFDLQRAKDITAVTLPPGTAGDSAVIARAEALPMAAACIFGEKTLVTARGERYLLYGNVLLKTSLLWPLRELGAQRLLLVEADTGPDGTNAREDKAARRLQDLLDTGALKRVLAIRVPRPKDAQNVGEWAKAGYAAVMERRMDIYDSLWNT